MNNETTKQGDDGVEHLRTETPKTGPSKVVVTSSPPTTQPSFNPPQTTPPQNNPPPEK